MYQNLRESTEKFLLTLSKFGKLYTVHTKMCHGKNIFTITTKNYFLKKNELKKCARIL